MAKEREKAYFEWQKSSNLYMILLTLIIFLVSVMDKTRGWIKILNIWILSFCVTFFGLAVILLNKEQLIYEWKHLRDKRKKVSGLERYLALIIYSFIALIGLLIILFGGYLMLVLLGFFPNPFNNL